MKNFSYWFLSILLLISAVGIAILGIQLEKEIDKNTKLTIDKTVITEALDDLHEKSKLLHEKNKFLRGNSTHRFGCHDLANGNVVCDAYEESDASPMRRHCRWVHNKCRPQAEMMDHHIQNEDCFGYLVCSTDHFGLRMSNGREKNEKMGGPSSIK